ncbi:unnamed protein product [Gadus morhua 'NCC']
MQVSEASTRREPAPSPRCQPYRGVPKRAPEARLPLFIEILPPTVAARKLATLARHKPGPASTRPGLLSSCPVLASRKHSVRVNELLGAVERDGGGWRRERWCALKTIAALERISGREGVTSLSRLTSDSDASKWKREQAKTKAESERSCKEVCEGLADEALVFPRQTDFESDKRPENEAGMTASTMMQGKNKALQRPVPVASTYPLNSLLTPRDTLSPPAYTQRPPPDECSSTPLRGPSAPPTGVYTLPHGVHSSSSGAPAPGVTDPQGPPPPSPQRPPTGHHLIPGSSTAATGSSRSEEPLSLALSPSGSWLDGPPAGRFRTSIRAPAHLRRQVNQQQHSRKQTERDKCGSLSKPSLETQVVLEDSDWLSGKKTDFGKMGRK